LDIKRRGRKLPQKQEIKVKVNEAIRYPEVRLVDADGEQLGVVPIEKAMIRILIWSKFQVRPNLRSVGL